MRKLRAPCYKFQNASERLHARRHAKQLTRALKAESVFLMYAGVIRFHSAHEAYKGFMRALSLPGVFSFS